MTQRTFEFDRFPSRSKLLCSPVLTPEVASNEAREFPFKLNSQVEHLGPKSSFRQSAYPEICCDEYRAIKAFPQILRLKNIDQNERNIRIGYPPREIAISEIQLDLLSSMRESETRTRAIGQKSCPHVSETHENQHMQPGSIDLDLMFKSVIVFRSFVLITEMDRERAELYRSYMAKKPVLVDLSPCFVFEDKVETDRLASEYQKIKFCNEVSDRIAAIKKISLPKPRHLIVKKGYRLYKPPPLEEPTKEIVMEITAKVDESTEKSKAKSSKEEKDRLKRAKKKQKELTEKIARRERDKLRRFLSKRKKGLSATRKREPEPKKKSDSRPHRAEFRIQAGHRVVNKSKNESNETRSREPEQKKKPDSRPHRSEFRVQVGHRIVNKRKNERIETRTSEPEPKKMADSGHNPAAFGIQLGSSDLFRAEKSLSVSELLADAALKTKQVLEKKKADELRKAENLKLKEKETQERKRKAEANKVNMANYDDFPPLFDGPVKVKPPNQKEKDEFMGKLGLNTKKIPETITKPVLPSCPDLFTMFPVEDNDAVMEEPREIPREVKKVVAPEKANKFKIPKKPSVDPMSTASLATLSTSIDPTRMELDEEEEPETPKITPFKRIIISRTPNVQMPAYNTLDDYIATFKNPTENSNVGVGVRDDDFLEFLMI